MAQAEYSEILSVDFNDLFSTITNYSAYPEFVDGCREVEVQKSSADGVRVKYQVSVMSQNITYVLDHKQDEKTGRVEWTLVESDFFKKNNGSWVLKKQCSWVYSKSVGEGQSPWNG
ncbi:MAG: hypothetical protein HYX41_06130 [Bdellovibrio sp.]|nr:hypothetical protein [Bdellovibrio sp.]